MSGLNVVSAETVRELVSAGAVLVDFGAPWCGPCRALEPHLLRLQDEYAGRLAVAKVDIDADPTLAGEFRIMSVPTLMLFKEGRLVATRSGGISYEQLKEYVSLVL